jgi:hypothetical protein
LSLPLSAYAQSTDSQAGAPPREPTDAAPASAKPGMNIEAFNVLRTQCERDVPVGKAHGNVCARVASIVLGEEAPEKFRELSSQLKSKAAVRFLEIGLVSSDIAAGRVYDIYSRGDVLGFGLLGGNADSFRAEEVMEIMLKRGYAGATLRQALSKVSFFNIQTTDVEKRQSCATAKQLTAAGKLDQDSKLFADAILESGFCRNLVEVERQEKEMRK